MKRLLVTGSRNWTDETALYRALLTSSLGWGRAVLVHGDARGADRMAAAQWELWGLPVEAHPADWRSCGRAAGLIRNQRMVDLGADLCLAFPLGESRGTWDCVARARKAGIEVRIIEPGQG